MQSEKGLKQEKKGKIRTWNKLVWIVKKDNSQWLSVS
jgi:hypothetical protein